MSKVRQKPITGSVASMPAVMNRRMAASLGLCRHPTTAAEGLKLFVPSAGATPSRARKPAPPGKTVPSMKSALSSKPARFAHLAGVLPAQQASARRSAPADTASTFVLDAGRRASTVASAPAPASKAKTFATPAAAVAFVLGAGVRR